MSSPKLELYQRVGSFEVVGISYLIEDDGEPRYFLRCKKCRSIISRAGSDNPKHVGGCRQCLNRKRSSAKRAQDRAFKNYRRRELSDQQNRILEALLHELPDRTAFEAKVWATMNLLDIHYGIKEDVLRSEAIRIIDEIDGDAIVED